MSLQDLLSGQLGLLGNEGIHWFFLTGWLCVALAVLEHTL